MQWFLSDTDPSHHIRTALEALTFATFYSLGQKPGGTSQDRREESMPTLFKIRIDPTRKI